MIKRSKHAQNYTVFPNQIFEQITDGLAIGILVYLLSKPPNWNVTKQQLYKHFTEGRQRVDKSFKLLELAGYIIGEQTRTKGKIQGYKWTVYDVPDPLLNSVFMENRLSGNHQSINEQLISNSLINTIDKSNDDNNIIDWDLFIRYFNKCFGKRSRVVPSKAKTQYIARLNEGFTKEDIMLAMTNAKNDSYHKETQYKHCTLEFFSRGDKLDRFMSMTPQKKSSDDYTPTT